MLKWLKLLRRGSHIKGLERRGGDGLWISTLQKVKSARFLTISNLAVLCTYETSLAPLQHIQTGASGCILVAVNLPHSVEVEEGEL